jgi:hypothetical protein
MEGGRERWKRYRKQKDIEKGKGSEREIDTKRRERKNREIKRMLDRK